jgi:dolichol-phosphate mannosyltransferase
MHKPSIDLWDLSIVIPLFNEEEVFPQLIARLTATLDSLPLSAEVILVDDGSTDATRRLATRACEEDPRFRLVVLSRNFGHQLAVSAGLRHAAGQAVAILDGDLQDPPEILHEFYRKLSEGYDVVYAIRRQRKEGLLKRVAYWGFYRLLRAVASIDIPLDSGDFCILSRRMVQQINAMPERHRFVRGLRSWIGFRQTGHEYSRAARVSGQSKYTLTKLLRLACDGLFTFSEAPLRLATFLGLIVALGAFGYGTFIALWRLLSSQEVPGFATLAAGMFFLGGVQLICLGIVGEYIGRIHNEVKGRPPFIVDQLVGFTSAAPGEERAAPSAFPGIRTGASRVEHAPPVAPSQLIQ